jgi:hypothetical protein
MQNLRSRMTYIDEEIVRTRWVDYKEKEFDP